MTDRIDHMTLLDVLVTGRANILRGWNQGNYAITADGGYAEPWDQTAACFCVIGSIRQQLRTTPEPLRYQAIDTLRAHIVNVLNGNGIVVWNDAPERTQADVVALFDAVILKAS